MGGGSAGFVTKSGGMSMDAAATQSRGILKDVNSVAPNRLICVAHPMQCKQPDAVPLHGGLC